jgi:hypothetical protein
MTASMNLQEVWEVEHAATTFAIAFVLKFPGAIDDYGSVWDEHAWIDFVLDLEARTHEYPSKMGHALFLALLHVEVEERERELPEHIFSF